METKQHATKKNQWGNQTACYWKESVTQQGNQVIPQDKWQWKHNLTKSIIKPMGGSKSRFKSEVHSDTGLPQETRHVSNT